MSFNEKIQKATQYCERNGDYRVVYVRGEKKPLLVRNRMGYVRTALVAE